MGQMHNMSRRDFFSGSGAAMLAAPIMAGQMLMPSIASAVTPPQNYSSTPVLDTVDVLVVGGGPAGIGAALGAARQGVKTLVIENHSFFGGVAAWAAGMMMNQMRPLINGISKPRSNIHELLISKLTAYGSQAARTPGHEVDCNVEYLKAAVLDAFDSAGCNYLVHVRAADAVVESGRITGVIVGTKKGMMRINAKVVIDTTGDADITYYAGAATLIETGNLSPASLAPNFTNVTSAVSGSVGNALSTGKTKYPLVPSSIQGFLQVSNSHFFFINDEGTEGFGQMDATDPVQRTWGECKSSKQIVQMTEAMREFGSSAELKGVELCGAGPQFGVRDTRRVSGVYQVTDTDAANGAIFADTIGWRSGLVDLGFIGGLLPMKIHDVPYRSLLPLMLDGLLTAGRCISTNHVGWACGKSMGNCMATGHGAGVAASIAAKKGITPRQVVVSEIQTMLTADGVNLFLTPAQRIQ